MVRPVILDPKQLPEDAIVISYSQAQMWARCRQAWYFQYELGYKKKTVPAVWGLGTKIHSGLEAYYAWRMGKSPGIDNGLEAVRAKFFPELQNPSAYDTVQQIGRTITILDRYIQDFGPNEDVGYTPEEVEAFRAIPLVTPNGVEYYLQVYIDLMLRHNDTGHLWIVDHKSTGSARFYSEIEIMMDAQLPTYGGAMTLSGEPVFGYMFQFINTYEYKDPNQPTEKLFKRSKTYRTDAELVNMINNIGRIVDDMQENKDKPFRAMKRDCSFCQFQEPCLLTMKGMPIEIAMEAEFGIKKNEGATIGSQEDDFEGLSPLI